VAVNAKRRFPWAIAVAVLLTLLLGTQILIAQRDRLAESPAWRPVISRLCLIAQCRIDAWRQPDAFVPLLQTVVADPARDGVLLVQISFKNTAEWPQPWPQIEVKLTDVNGDALGLRRFRPKDYLNADQAGDIKPQQTVSVEIAVQETTGKAAGFTFEFH